MKERMTGDAGYHIATAARDTFSLTTPRGMLAAMIEQHPELAWAPHERAIAMAMFTSRNAMLHWILTGQRELSSKRAGVA